MKDINLKIWPDLTSIHPAMVPLPRVRNEQGNNVNIDMSNIVSVNATGLVVILVELLKIMNNAQQLRTWKITYPEAKVVNRLMTQLGFYEVISDFFLQKDIFWPYANIKKNSFLPINKSTSSLPIYELRFNQYNNRRECLDPFVDWLFEIFEALEGKFQFSANKFIPVLHEMAKNSADHTVGNAILGIDILSEGSNGGVKICFVFGDLGEGINQSIAKFISNDPEFTLKHKHLSLSDAYHYALGQGNTTKPTSGTNRGLGMSIIYDIAKALDLHLSVFDANSRGILSQAKNKTHKELRKVFYNIGNSVGFYYYGEFNLMKR